MKLEKREITLNEADSLLDMLYLEERLLNVYSKGAKKAFRKELVGEFSRLLEETRKECESVSALLKNSKNAFVVK